MIHIYGFPLLPPSYDGLSFFIFIFFRSRQPSPTLINHERIHFYQQLELLFIFHWLLYLVHYIFLLIYFISKPRKSGQSLHDKAYRNICFEQEAYDNERNPHYLEHRKPFAWFRYLRPRGTNPRQI